MKLVKLVLNFPAGQRVWTDVEHVKNFNLAAVESIEETYEMSLEEFKAQYPELWQSKTAA